jgi:hypothetical protein
MNLQHIFTCKIYFFYFFSQINPFSNPFSFPKNQNFHALWVQAIREQFPAAKIHCASKICSLHFPDNAFAITHIKTKLLKASAIPVVEFAWDDDEGSDGEHFD